MFLIYAIGTILCLWNGTRVACCDILPLETIIDTRFDASVCIIVGDSDGDWDGIRVPNYDALTVGTLNVVDGCQSESVNSKSCIANDGTRDGPVVGAIDDAIICAFVGTLTLVGGSDGKPNDTIVATRVETVDTRLDASNGTSVCC